MTSWIRRLFGRTVDLQKDPDEQAARHAAHQAQVEHQRAIDDSGEIRILSEELRSLRETNHFAELIRTAIQNGHSR